MFWTIHLAGGPCWANNPAIAVGDKIYSFGNSCGRAARSLNIMEVRVLNTRNYHWRTINFNDDQITTRPCERYGHSAVAYRNNVYVWGGTNDDEEHFFAQLHCFNTTTSTWNLPAVFGNIPKSRENHFACMVGQNMYIIGGYEENELDVSRQVYTLDLESMEWRHVRAVGHAPRLSTNSCIAVLDSRIYFFSGTYYWNEVTYFDTICCRWHRLIASGRVFSWRAYAQTFVRGRYIYLFGGCDEVFHLHYNDVQRYSPDNNEWKTVKTLGIPPSPRYRHLCVVVGDRVFVLGGITSHGALLLKESFTEFSANDMVFCLDMHVLDMSPSLRTLCLCAVLQYKLDVSGLPYDLQTEIVNMTCNILQIFV